MSINPYKYRIPTVSLNQFTYKQMLNYLPLKEIEQYLRKIKLERIKNVENDEIKNR